MSAIYSINHPLKLPSPSRRLTGFQDRKYNSLPFFQPALLLIIFMSYIIIQIEAQTEGLPENLLENSKSSSTKIHTIYRDTILLEIDKKFLLPKENWTIF